MKRASVYSLMKRRRKSRIARAFFMLPLALLFLIGWVMAFVGEEKEERSRQTRA